MSTLRLTAAVLPLVLLVPSTTGLPLALLEDDEVTSWISHAGFALVLSNAGLEYAKEV